jgi:predicted HTH transcriptional regulator
VELLQAGIGFVMRNSKKPWKKLPDRRVEFPEYPERAVTEGLVNALIHRSYTELGSEVHIDMFDDRLEIYSPGGMVDGTIIDNEAVVPVPSHRRNTVLADIFNRLKYMERRGSGFKKILDSYKFQEHYNEKLKPEFYAKYNSFILILYNLNYV